MKKFYPLLALLVCLLYSIGAKATINSPLLSTSGATYPYYIKCCKGSNLYFSKSSSATDFTSDVQLYYANTADYNRLEFVLRASSTKPGYVNMYAVVNSEEIPVCLGTTSWSTSGASGVNVILKKGGTPAEMYLGNDLTGTNQSGLKVYVGSSTYALYNTGSDNHNNTVFQLATTNVPGGGTGWKEWTFEYAGSTALTTDQVTLGNTEYTNMATVRSTSSDGVAYTALQKYVAAVKQAQTDSKIGTTVGYPTSDATTTFMTSANAWLGYEAVVTTSEFTTAVNTLLTTIKKPEAGHIYKIKPVFSDDTTYDLFWDDEAMTNHSTVANRINGDTEANLTVDGSLDKSTYFYCGEASSKHFFVNKDGKYLNWFDPGENTSGAGNKCYNLTGATDDYNATYNLWTLEPADPVNGTVSLGQNTTYSSTSATALNAWAEMLGRFQMKAAGGNGSSYYLNPRYPADTKNSVTNTMDFVSTYSANKYYDMNNSQHRTYTFLFEEVTDYAPMVLQDGGNGVGYGTYSSPFPFVGIAGQIYYIASSDSQYNDETNVITFDNGYTVTSTNSVNLKKDFGLLVKGTPGKYIPIPAAVSNTAAASITTLLVATGGDGMTVEANNDTNGKAYILGKGSQGLGFYLLSSTNRTLNPFRAYLKLSNTATGASTSSGSAIMMNFDDLVNGIEVIATTNSESSNAPIYDLSGRRVSTPVKGNLYIQNGKKYIAR